MPHCSGCEGVVGGCGAAGHMMESLDELLAGRIGDHKGAYKAFTCTTNRTELADNMVVPRQRQQVVRARTRREGPYRRRENVSRSISRRDRSQESLRGRPLAASDSEATCVAVSVCRVSLIWESNVSRSISRRDRTQESLRGRPLAASDSEATCVAVSVCRVSLIVYRCISVS